MQVNDINIDFSIVIPVYYNQGSLEGLIHEINSEVIEKRSNYVCEVIFVDDGSGDNSFQKLLEIRDNFKGIVKVIKLTRNFGQIKAILCGYNIALGKCVIVMSADGQDSPKMINEMLKYHFEEGNDIVICSRAGREESLFRKITSALFYNIIKILSFNNMPSGGFDFVLMSRRALETFLKNTDTYPFFQGQVMWMGYKTKIIEYIRKKRTDGVSKWTFNKKITYLMDGIIAYSFFPIRITSLLGIFLALLGFLYALIVLFGKIIYGNPVKGWTPLMIVILIIGGFQMIMIGILGEYMWRTLDQVRNRQAYIIDKIYE